MMKIMNVKMEIKTKLGLPGFKSDGIVDDKTEEKPKGKKK